MKLDKTTETLLIFMAAFVILFTAYFVDRVCADNNVSSEYTIDMTLTGARLSDGVYATVAKSGEGKARNHYFAQFDFSIQNNGNIGISNWTATIDVPKGTELSNFWGVEADIEGDKLVFTPEFYNLSFSKNDKLDFGVVLNTGESFYPSKINFRGYKTGRNGNVFTNIIFVAFIIWAALFVGFFVTRFNLKNYREKQKNDVRVILQSMNTFISFIDAKDPYTRGHSRRVAMYAAEIAKRMRLTEDEVQNVYYAGLLHDAGKISVPDAVLNKPGRLSDEERKQIQDHTVAGGKMLKQMTSLRGIRETALYHHERYDGDGYPEGLKGESIPLYARIVGVADSYDAMSSNRVYRRHLNKDEIIEEIQKGSGTQFDPNIVPYMVDMINDGYVNVVKMETAENDSGENNFHLTEDDIPGVYMGF
ncbi:HD domain-containing phosphohydrolase [Butyrivibrio sp. XPD2006]|uniref:HD domain-containing phosphohydrolase n=1 Tax=Butyrivibrio sp. XPD2006 TaxID=1280668 RepID=UPI0003B5B8A8|nr:HD domain-containing phosphohydrolase [Butyrivibrio sp. XPD2006]